MTKPVKNGVSHTRRAANGTAKAKRIVRAKKPAAMKPVMSFHSPSF
jgi:hypothetical protein